MGNAWRLLVVEDSTGDVELIRDMLQDSPEPWVASYARTLTQASHIIAAESFDVITADLGLPDSAGLDTLVKLLGHTQQTPLVVLTGTDDEGLGPTAVALGAHDYLDKGGLSSPLLTRALRLAIERGHREQQLHDIIRENCDAMMILDATGVIRVANPAAEALFGNSPLVGEILGYPVQVDRTAELTVVSNDEPRITEMRTAATIWGGEPAVLVSLRDVTDTKRAEELQRRLWHADRLVAVGQLAAGVVHEINNPAAFVLGNLRLIDEELRGLQQAAAPGEAAEVDADRLSELRLMLEDCREGVARIARIAKDMRVFSRIEGDEVEAVDLNELVRAAHRMTAAETRHRAQVKLDLAPLPTIAADRSKLMQVLTNLIVNAAQAIEPGSVSANSITLQTRCHATHLTVRVEDTGRGIDPNHLDRIFDPFFTTKPRGEGTGLGLPLSADIIRKHAGRLAVESEVGEGTAMLITLPRYSDLTHALDHRHAMAPEAPNRPYRLLFIDDELALLRVIKRQLKGEHDVYTARTATRGLELIESSPPFDAVVCDLMMPDVGGIEFYERVRDRFPEVAKRIIICTGGACLPRIKQQLAQVDAPVIGKPFEIDDLLSLVRHVDGAA